MIRAVLLSLLTLSAVVARAQRDLDEKDVSPATRRYHELRQQDTEPPFALAKAKAAIKPLDDEKTASPLWPRMSVEERFTYCMLHGEVFDQNCAEMPWFVDEEEKVFAYPAPFEYGQAQWSPRQTAFLKGRRGAVVGLLRRTIQARGSVGANLKAAIIEVQANELIPDLATVYRRDPRDQDILTAMAVLMKNGGDRAFRASRVGRTLYGPGASYKSFVVASEANRRLILGQAMAFSRRRSR